MLLLLLLLLTQLLNLGCQGIDPANWTQAIWIDILGQPRHLGPTQAWLAAKSLYLQLIQARLVGLRDCVLG